MQLEAERKKDLPIASSYLHIINKMFNKLKASIKKKAITWLDDKGEPSQNAMSGGYGSIADILGCTTHGSYDNNFPNITRISEAFSEVEPYAIDANGKRLTDQPHIIDILYNPNEEMSGPDFWETLMVMLLVHPIVYILCWHEEKGKNVAGGPITKDNISGLTFLENVSAVTVGGKTTYYCGTNTYTKEDVIALSLNVNPYSLLSGYSPSMAAKKWATADDCIADHQTSFFRNGAVPAGQFVITAPTVKAFNQCVDSLQAHHRGALNYNNPIYVHRPTSAIDGKPMAAQVEWVPFSQSTDTKTLQSIFDQANKKIDIDFGVPQEVKGYLQNSNYASVEVADYIFARRVLYPKLKKVWAKLTHELNRITGGLDCAIGFDFDLPILTDTRKSQVDTLNTLLNKGFTLESAVEALQLPRSFLQLKKDETSAEPATFTNESNNDNVDITNDQTVEKSLKQKAETTLNTEKIWEQTVDPRLLELIGSYMNGIIGEAARLAAEKFEGNEASRKATINDLKGWLATSGFTEEVIQAVIALLLQLMESSSKDAAAEFAAMLGIPGVDVQLTDAELREYSERIEELLMKFANDTVSAVNKVLQEQEGENFNREGLNRVLIAIMVDEAYRAERWAASEQHIAESGGVLLAAKRAAEKTHKQAMKTWRINPASPDICLLCVRMDGETVPYNQPFSNGYMISHRHPHCWCDMEISFVEPHKSIANGMKCKEVRITCPKCGRYMFKSAECQLKGIKCRNSKCNREFDIEVKQGKANFSEVKHND